MKDIEEENLEEPTVSYETEITRFDQLDLSKLYSYADYFRWKFKDRVELIRGLIHRMSPAPAPVHQTVSGNLFLQIAPYFKKKGYRVFTAPFDVRLPDSKRRTSDKEIFTVVQPDLCVICDPAQIDSRGCVGAPDLVIEILSPGNSAREMGIKFDLYEENQAKEYWLVDTRNQTILIYTLENGKFRGLKPLTEGSAISSLLFPELSFEVGEVFEKSSVHA